MDMWNGLEAHMVGDGPASWRDAHQRYFTRNGGFAPDMLLNCERFRLVEVISPPPCGEGSGVGVSTPAPAVEHPHSQILSPQGGEGFSEQSR